LFLTFSGNFKSVRINAVRLLNVKPEEQAKVVLMLAMGFFIGIFVATYQVTAESLFLNKLSADLNKAFLISGGLGIAVTLIFSFFQNRIRFVALAFFSLVLIFASTFALNYFYHFGNEQLTNRVLLLMYCLAGPITALLLLCYWGIFARLFDFKQSKRIIGWIDTGQLVAIILANFLIPLSARFFPDTSQYLLVCDVSIVGALVCLGTITVKFGLARAQAKVDDSVKKETTFVQIFKDKYVVLLSFFLIISVVTFNFNQFIFQNLLNEQYPNQRDLTNFLAYFNGAIYLLSLVMQTFLNKIIGGYGLRVSLFILPIVTGFLALSSFLAALLFGFSVSVSPDTFIYFFLFVALSRLFNITLRDSLENPVYKLMFVPLDSRLRFGIQAKVEGVVSESGRLIAGIFIFLLSLTPFFKILWIPVIITALCAVYILVVQNLYVGYKNKIKSKLENTDYHQEKLEIGFKQISARLAQQLVDRHTSKAVFSFRLLEKLNPAQISNWVNSLMKNGHEEAREYAQRRMNELNGLSVSDQYVIHADQSVQDFGGKKLLSKIDLEAILGNGGEIAKKRIQKLSRSQEVNDRQYAAELLLHSTSEENSSFLIELLADSEPKVRKTAIATAIKINNPEIIFALINNLPNPIYSNQAMSALVLIGGKALHPLENAFYRSGQGTQTILRIVQVMGRIGGERAKDLLWGKIDYPDKVVVSQVLISLGECGFKAGISQITRIKYAIENDIADIVWNLNAMQEIGGEGDRNRIQQALEEEDRNDIEHIYMLMAMLYDTRSIQLVKENIESGTSEGTSYAVELLDVFLSEQLKVKVIPVLDDLATSEKLKRLEIFYPRVRLDSKLVLKFLINRDFTQSNRWTKACALGQIGTQKIADFKLDLIAQLFNPDRLIREMAGWALYQIDPLLYESNSKRLEEKIKRWLDRSILPHHSQTQLRLYEKIIFFRSLPIFEGITGVALSFLADISREVRLVPDEFLSIDEKVNNDFFVVFRGSVQYYEKSQYVMDYNAGQFVGEVVASTGFANSNLLITKEETVLLKINKDQFYELLADNVKLADKVLEYI
jgi:ATP:ADP antiporter, AAA family